MVAALIIIDMDSWNASYHHPCELAGNLTVAGIVM